MKHILVRADSSSMIGTGHIMRDLVLVKQFKDAYITFAVLDLPGNINHKIKEAGYPLYMLQSNKIDELATVVNDLEIDMLIIDHYGIDGQAERTLKEKTSVQLFVLDDTYESHYCDILLNHNIYADAEKYTGLVPKNCELRCGEKYTLLRDEFIEAKQNRSLLTERDVKKIFIAMGGSDIADLNPKILDILDKFENISVDMVTTSANQNLEELKNSVLNRAWVNLHINSNQISQLMTESDLAIVTPSVTMNEVWYMEIPYIAIQVAENQAYMSQFLIGKHGDVLEQFDESKLYELILQHLKCGSRLINFTDLTLEEKKRVLHWRNDESIRKWMYNKSLITLEDHLHYIDSLKGRSDRVYFLVRDGYKEIGVIDLTSIDPEKASAEIGLYARPGLKGVGDILMKSIIEYGFNVLKLKVLYSNVYTDNMKAINLYKKFAFIENMRDEKLITMELKNEDR